MKCTEVENLLEPYLDSELDTRTTELVRQHLEQCPGCAARFQIDTQFEATLRQRLKAPPRTPGLWQEQERFVATEFGQRQIRTRTAAPGGHPLIRRLSRWREWLWPNPVYYAGLAAVWALMLIVHLSSAEPRQDFTISQPHPPLTPEVRMLLSQQRQTLRTLLSAPEAEAQSAEESQPAPRSEQAGDQIHC